jgi:5-(carboxyamino)imidazole ribonucleotide synthase
MLNLVGGWPEPSSLLAVPGAHLHLYGKAPRPGRKVGHVTVRCDDPTALAERLAGLERVIRGAVADVPGPRGPVADAPGPPNRSG